MSSTTRLHRFSMASEYHRETLSTGSEALDSLLEGGFETGLFHLFYGDRVVQDELLCFATMTGLMETRISYPVVLVAPQLLLSRAMLEERKELVAILPRSHLQFEYYVEYRLPEIIETSAVKALVILGMSEVYRREGNTRWSRENLPRIVSKISSLSVMYDIAVVACSLPIPDSMRYTVFDGILSTFAQVHVEVQDSPTRTHYVLKKHPYYSLRSTYRSKPGDIYAVTYPLAHHCPEISDRPHWEGDKPEEYNLEECAYPYLTDDIIWHMDGHAQDWLETKWGNLVEGPDSGEA